MQKRITLNEEISMAIVDVKTCKDVKKLMAQFGKSVAFVKRRAFEGKLTRVAFDEINTIIDMAEELRDLRDELLTPKEEADERQITLDLKEEQNGTTGSIPVVTADLHCGGS